MKGRPRILDRLRGRLGRRLLEPFPPVGGNSVVPLLHGDDFYLRMVEGIARARRSVEVEMYLWDDDEIGARFVEALRAAAARGVRVRVLADAYGSRAVAGALRAVSGAGGDVRWFNPFRFPLARRLLHRTHRKLLVLDGECAFTGGAGFSRHFSGGKRSERPWRDRMYEIRGPAVEEIDATFDADFGRWEPEGPVVPSSRDGVPPPVSGTSVLRVLRGWPDVRDLTALLRRAIDDARERVWIGTPYFLPERRIRRGLYAAARRGVDVRVIHPSRRWANALLWYAVRARYGRWLARGVGVHEFEHAFYHAKIAVFDRSLAVVGSSNLDSWSWRRNSEFDVAVLDPGTVDAMARLFEDDLAGSRAVTREEVRVRNVAQRMKERFASALEEWL